MAHDRRTVLAAGASCLLTWQLGGCEQRLTPAEARGRRVPLRSLDAAQARTLEALGEALVPGARAAGLVHFVDQQLGVPPAEQLLMLKYLRVEPPFAPFYAAGLAGLDAASRAAHAREFAALGPAEATALLRRMSQADPPGWQGPPAALFYFVVRSDAIDVVYGTPRGFAALGIPYAAHIAPPETWST